MTIFQTQSRSHRIFSTIVSVFGLIFVTVAAAQNAGIVTGRVSNAGTAA
ncbi:MAG: hypothetical protein ACREH8_04685 [Opitutaceae bacterium]